MTATLAGGNVLQANYPSDQSALSLQTLLERQKVDFAAMAPSHGSVFISILVSLAAAPPARGVLDLRHAADARRRGASAS